MDVQLSPVDHILVRPDSYIGSVETITATARAFAAKLKNGTVVTWGDVGYGGDSSAVQSELKDVETIYSTLGSRQFGAFAAKLANGRVVTWGYAGSGGDLSGLENMFWNGGSSMST